MDQDVADQAVDETDEGTLSIATAVTKSHANAPPNAEIVFGDVVIDGGMFIFNARGLETIGIPSYALWERVGQWLSGTANKIQFWIGDWVNYGDGHFADRVDQAVDVTEWKEDTVLQYARVSAAVPPENRNPDLSYAHHRAVYAQTPEQQAAWLNKAELEGWSDTRLRAEVQQATKPQDTTCWLVVSCRDAADRDVLADQMRSAGREVKLS